jgi:hypothetical protein
VLHDIDGSLLGYDAGAHEVLLGCERAALDYGVRNLGGEQADRAQGVIVAGNDPVDLIRVAVRVNDGYDRDTEAAGFRACL